MFHPLWTAKNDNGRDFRLWEEGELWEETNWYVG